MKPLSIKELAKAANLNIPGGTIIARALMLILKYNRLNKACSSVNIDDSIGLIDALIEQLDLYYEVPEEELKNLPASGGFIIVSNHPYGGIDTMLLYKVISRKRPDLKVLANYLLQKIDPLKDVILPVDPFNKRDKSKDPFKGLKDGMTHVREGNCLAVFPAGEGPAFYEDLNLILDKEWQFNVLREIKNAEVPVVPVYFHGTYARWFQILGKVHPLMQITSLPAELFPSKNRNIKIRIGSPVSVREQSEFKDIAQYGRFLRARTYLLGSALEARKFFIKKIRYKRLTAEPVLSPVDNEILIREFDQVRSEHELLSVKNISVICAPANKIPYILNEIGRLRELTFREVGEGTNKSTDIDEYDLYYNHLFLWDTEKNRIIGAYRIGKGKDIEAFYGTRGFYLNSLFKFRKDFIPVLKESLELGRSFIVKDYQKKPLPLFLLWKGIMFFLIRNPEYRYLIGPVSISNNFSKFSKSLIVEFIKAYFFNESLAKNVIPRKKFVVKPDRIVDRKVFIDTSESDINKIERIIMDVQPGYKLPVLLKKYLEINGHIIGFNIDPKFNDCLDGLLILDMFNAPPDVIKGLSRDMNDESILSRFRL
jgi:putative hemolysin